MLFVGCTSLCVVLFFGVACCWLRLLSACSSLFDFVARGCSLLFVVEARCLLLVVWCLLLVLCRLDFVVACSSCVVCCLLSFVFCLLFIVRGLLIADCILLRAARCVVFIDCCSLLIVSF